MMARTIKKALSNPVEYMPRNAWSIWKALAWSGSMVSPDGRERMLGRHEIVVRIIDANSRILRLDNEINGLDIDRRIAERSLQNEGPSQAINEVLAEVNVKLRRLEEEKSRLTTEREWLEVSLDDFDRAGDKTTAKTGDA